MNSYLRADPMSYVSHMATNRPRRLLQYRDTISSQVQLVFSVLLSVTLLSLLAFHRDGVLQDHYRYLMVIVFVSQLMIYNWRGVFRRFNGFFGGCLRIGRAWILLVFVVFSTIFFSQTGEQFSRVVIFSWAIFGYLSQIIAYQVFCHVSNRTNYRSDGGRRALVVGTGPIALKLVSSVNRNNWISDRIIGWVSVELDVGKDDINALNIPLFGGLDKLIDIISENEISRVYVVAPVDRSETIENIYKLLSNTTIDLIWVPDTSSMQLVNYSIKELNGLPLITLSESPLSAESKALLKSIFDKLIALTMLLLLSPLMAAIAFLVWLSSPGPIIFRQNRHGWDGRIIEVWKFRSMKVHTDRGVSQAKRNDDRVTRIGRFIRRTSIDELPQLFNVIQGKMSLIGPRPHAIEHNEFYSRQIPSYMLRHRIKPGLTGLAQVNGYRGETETLDKMLRRVELDIHYINNWSIFLDLIILLKTPATLLSKEIY